MEKLISAERKRMMERLRGAQKETQREKDGEKERHRQRNGKSQSIEREK